jgi:1-aminocyclopropane-1-carboxylate deaminase/D-cysteine desulfhydrase-like pyridoxal-dependent ACC family enzyme
LIALANHVPQVRVPWVSIGQWPTPVTALEIEGRPVWVKQEGDAHPLYGGNKVRTLELWFGHALARGARRIWAIGAYGSNHAVATVAHAARAGLDAAAMLFPQPASEWALENCGALVASGCELLRLASVVSVPFMAWRVARRERDALVMPPGGATPIGTFGALAAAFELADQIATHQAPPPRRIVLAVGSTCTAAGMLAGLSLAHALGVWRWPVPIVHGVRVTPWPITSRVRTADLARRTLLRVERLGGPRIAVGLRQLVSRLVIDGDELGGGYGRTTPRCDAAMRAIASPRLDGVYSGKAAAALLRLHRAGTEPLLFWSSKSTATLAPPSGDQLDRAPAAIARWWRRHDASLAAARASG